LECRIKHLGTAFKVVGTPSLATKDIKLIAFLRTEEFRD
jgi:hypothetical protein